MLAVALAHPTALAARGGETAELAVLHHGLACGGERRTVSSRDSTHVNRSAAWSGGHHPKSAVSTLRSRVSRFACACAGGEAHGARVPTHMEHAAHSIRGTGNDRRALKGSLAPPGHVPPPPVPSGTSRDTWILALWCTRPGAALTWADG